MGKIAAILIFLSLAGCAHLQTARTESVIDQLESGKLAILASCEFYNAAGEVIRKYPGDICVPMDNGDLYVSNNVQLTKLNKDNQVIWSCAEPVHHQMKKSFNNRDLYFISGYYQYNGSERIRQDTIKVIDENGKVKKQFDFSNYLKTQDPEYIGRYKYRNTWSFNGVDQTFFEYTHVNSIYEILGTDKSGQPFLNGYIVNDRSLGKVFFFDPELKLQRVFDFTFEAMHDVSFVDPDTIIYFSNSNPTSPAKSRVVSFNILTNEKNVIYGGPDNDFYSKHNGGVQPLAQDLFMISHAPKPSKSYVEIISKRGVVLKRIFLNGARKFIQDARLGDYREFFKKNIGN